MLFFDDLKLVLSSFDKDFKTNTNITNVTNTLVNGVNYLVGLFKEYESVNKFISKDEFYLYINFNILLIYVYYRLYKNNSDIIFVINDICKKFKKDFRFESYTGDNSNNLCKLNLEKINKLSQKYNYLLHIDRENFVKSIIRDYDNSDNKFQPVDLTKGIVVNKPSILDVSNFTVIKNDRFKNNNIIDRYYLQLLLINSNETIIENVEIDYRLSKLIDIINNRIIPAIDKRLEMIQMNPSTILIYDEFISPFIKTAEISIDEILFLIFNITIPYIYDRYKIEKYIDYFH